MSSLIKHFYQFGEFTLDTDQRVLLREGKPLTLTPKVFDTLLILVENGGRLVEKEELMSRLWPETFVEEANLTFNVQQLRKALGDNARAPVYIETITKRGYRFIAELNYVEGEEERDNRFGLIDDSAPRSSGKIISPARFPRRVDETGNQASTGAVALADWRRKAGVNESNESATTASPDPSIRRVANLELVRAARGKRENHSYVLAGLIALALLAGLGYGIYHLAGESKKPASSPFKVTRITSNGKTRTAAASPDGRFITYVIDDRGEQSLWLKNIATGSDVQILPPAENTWFGGLTFSPDGDYIFYGAKGMLFRLPVLGGAPVKVLTGYAGPISFSPDGKQFAFVRHSSDVEETASIVIINADGSDERILASSKRPALFLRSAAWSPDGKVIVCAALNPTGSQGVVIARVADGVVSPLPSSPWSAISQVAWRPDGKSLLVIAVDYKSSLHQVWSLSYPGGEARRVTDDFNDYRSISVPAGASSIVAVRAEQEAHIWVVQGEDASRAIQLTGGFEKYDGVFALSWTTDGRIVYEAAPSGYPAVWTINPNGRGLKEISAESGEPAVSPDGRFLVYQSKDAEGTGLFRLSVGDGEKRRLTTGVDIHAAFSPDGEWVIFTRYTDDVALWKVSTEGGEAVRLTNDVSGMALVPAVSPDGRLIAFHLVRSSRGQLPEIGLIPFEGGEIIKTFDTPKQHWQNFAKNALQWTPDGQGILFTAERDDVSNIWRQPLDGGPAVQVTNFESGLIFNFSYSPDGRQLALSRGRFNRDVILINSSE
ncbi:MAG TPA: winged helix-turn-helix domain-containing protein [Blastocatellia bacterium]|nr:winged helix-turn-helix domain-containing protein [Blastocatellia bacterium]